MLPRWYNPPQFRVVSPRQIIEAVATLHGVSIDEILGASRLPHICRARWTAMRELRDRRFSTPAIGALLNRDHTTVIHGLRRAG